MSDRSDRLVVAVVGFLLLLGGGLAACLGAGLFGTARTDSHVFGSTVAHWWAEGGWESFAVVTAIGVVALALGAYLALAQVHRNDGRQRTPTRKVPPKQRRPRRDDPSLGRPEPQPRNRPGVHRRRA